MEQPDWELREQGLRVLEQGGQEVEQGKLEVSKFPALSSISSSTFVLHIKATPYSEILQSMYCYMFASKPEGGLQKRKLCIIPAFFSLRASNVSRFARHLDCLQDPSLGRGGRELKKIRLHPLAQ